MYRWCCLFGAQAMMLVACGQQAKSVEAAHLWKVSDAAGDLRVTHPPADGIQNGSFDLVSFTLLETATTIIAKAEFAAPVRKLRNIRLSEDRVATIYPQTIDIYVDTTPRTGSIKTLPGREVYVPASHAWERVLVMSSIRDLYEPGVVYPTHLIASGRTLTGTFDKQDIEAPIRGALVLVAATSTRGDGRIRLASPFKGTCTDWNQDRCTLIGAGPPILDSTSDIASGRPTALTYFQKRHTPRPHTTPIVFRRGRLVGAGPVGSDRLKPGHMATILDKQSRAIATAVIVSLVDGTASLEVLGGANVDAAAHVSFEEVRP